MKDAVSPDGLIPDAGAKTTLEAMASFNPKVKRDRIDLARTYTNDFTRRALAKVR